LKIGAPANRSWGGCAPFIKLVPARAPRFNSAMKLLPKRVSRTFAVALGILLCAWHVAGQTIEHLDFAFPSKTVYLKQEAEPGPTPQNQSAKI
jgi:hypothetical protein